MNNTNNPNFRPSINIAGGFTQTANGSNINQMGIVTDSEVNVNQTAHAGQSEPSKADRLTLQEMFATLEAQINQQAPLDKKASALERLTELKEALAAEKPDRTTLNTMEYVKDWFTKHLPTFAGAVTSVMVHPIVGKLVETAGDILAKDFRDRFGVKSA